MTTKADDGTEQEINIDEIYFHEEFNRGVRLNNDIALIKLKSQGIRLGAGIQPICLPPSNLLYSPGLNCTISGWGSVKSAGSDYIRSLEVASSPGIGLAWTSISAVDTSAIIQAGLVPGRDRAKAWPQDDFLQQTDSHYLFRSSTKRRRRAHKASGLFPGGHHRAFFEDRGFLGSERSWGSRGLLAKKGISAFCSGAEIEDRMSVEGSSPRSGWAVFSNTC
uniref:Peptidase S1 domain-containing protein n=1 Tax=Timema cristinae TaxID=61476 RepID=A0A7R9D8X0_TIMCR|nr:unnamed protein product [Timema cristinae]